MLDREGPDLLTHFEWHGSKKHAAYVGATKSDERRLLWYDELLGAPLPDLKDWVAPSLRQYLGDGNRKRAPAPIGDSPSSGQLNLVSEDAVSALGDIFQRHTFLYPVLLEDAAERLFFMVVPNTKIDCIDRERSKGMRAKYGPNPHLFASIDEWIFREDEIGDADMFVLPDSPTTTFVVSVSSSV